MSDYISRQAAIEALEGWKISGEMILGTVPSADVVEVVRCKDCKYYRIWQMKCDKLHVKPFADNHYCSFGERADNG